MSDRAAALMRDMEELEARKRKLDCEILKRRDRSEAKLAEAEVHSAAAAALMQTFVDACGGARGGASRRRAGSSSGRRTSWVSCSTSYRSLTTSRSRG